MVLVLILCTIISLITILICMFLFSTIRIQIDDFMASNIKKTKQEMKRTKNKYTLSVYLLNKIKWLKISSNSKIKKKIYSKFKLEKFDIKKMEKSFSLEDLKELKKIKPKISYLDLELKVGTEDVIVTSFVVCIISTLISILLPYTIKKYEKDKYKYEIIALYKNQNLYEIKFNCIIEVKIVHIINVIYSLVKKRRGEKNERTSNRRSYGYSYE